MQRSWLQWILTGKRPTILTLRPAIPLTHSHISVTKYGPWSLSGGFSLIAAVEVASLEIGEKCHSSAARQLSFYRSQTYLSPPAADHGIWTLLKMDRTTSVQDVKVKTDFEKRLMWKWEWKQILKKYYCKSESDECSAETLLPQSRGTPLQLLQQLQLLIKKRKGLHWLVQWTILTIQLWSWLFWERKEYIPLLEPLKGVSK